MRGKSHSFPRASKSALLRRNSSAPGKFLFRTAACNRPLLRMAVSPTLATGAPARSAGLANHFRPDMCLCLVNLSPTRFERGRRCKGLESTATCTLRTPSAALYRSTRRHGSIPRIRNTRYHHSCRITTGNRIRRHSAAPASEGLADLPEDPLPVIQAGPDRAAGADPGIG